MQASANHFSTARGTREGFIHPLTEFSLLIQAQNTANQPGDRPFRKYLIKYSQSEALAIPGKSGI